MYSDRAPSAGYCIISTWPDYLETFDKRKNEDQMFSRVRATRGFLYPYGLMQFSYSMNRVVIFEWIMSICETYLVCASLVMRENHSVTPKVCENKN